MQFPPLLEGFQFLHVLPTLVSPMLSSWHESFSEPDDTSENAVAGDRWILALFPARI